MSSDAMEKASDSAWNSSWPAIWAALAAAEAAPREARFAELLRLLPGDVVEGVFASVSRTLDGDDGEDPYGAAVPYLVIAVRSLLYPGEVLDLGAFVEAMVSAFPALETSLFLERERRQGAVVQIPGDPFQVSEREPD